MLKDASHLYALEKSSAHLTFFRVGGPFELIEALPGVVDGGDISNESGVRTSAETEEILNNTNRNLSIPLGRILKSDRRRFMKEGGLLWNPKASRWRLWSHRATAQIAGRS